MRKFFLFLFIFIILGSLIVGTFARGGIYDPFHTKEEKIALWKTLWDSHAGTEYYSVGKTFTGADIWLFTAGNPNGGCLLWDGELHGNEDKGSEILYLIAQWLLESGDARAAKILRENYVLFIPVINSNTERGNGNTEYSTFGVDLNRNFKAGWQKSAANSDTFSGPYALSEPETHILRNVFDSYKPTFYVNMHCGAGPYAAYYNGGDIALSEQVKLESKKVCAELGITPYTIGSFGSRGYAIGDAVALGVKSAWIIEAVGLNTAWRHLQENYDELVNVYYPKCLAIFIAMCSLIGSDESHPEGLPKIQAISQYPPQDVIPAGYAPQVNVTLTQSTVGFVNVYLNYSINGKDWSRLDMVKVGKTIWSAHLPVALPGSQVTYSVIAENNVGTTKFAETMSYKYSHQTMPEFTSLTLTLLILFLTLTIIVMKYRHGSELSH